MNVLAEKDGLEIGGITLADVIDRVGKLDATYEKARGLASGMDGDGEGVDRKKALEKYQALLAKHQELAKATGQQEDLPAGIVLQKNLLAALVGMDQELNELADGLGEQVRGLQDRVGGLDAEVRAIHGYFQRVEKLRESIVRASMTIVEQDIDWRQLPTPLMPFAQRRGVAVAVGKRRQSDRQDEGGAGDKEAAKSSIIGASGRER